MDHKMFMSEALQEAAKARDSNDWAIGCIITLDGEVVARGRNRVFSAHNRLLHAETEAIRELQEKHFDSKGKNLVLYTTLEPCPMCFGAILLAGVRTIVAGTNLDQSGVSATIDTLPEFFMQPHFKTTLITGVLATECEKMWLSGTPAKSVMKRNIKINYATDADGIQIYTSPVQHLEPDAENTPNSQKEYTHSLKSAFSSEH